MYTLFSADDHILEHATVWSSRLPARYQEAGLHVITDDEGKEFWVHEGRLGQSVNGTIGDGAPAGVGEEIRHKKSANEPRREPYPYTFADMIPACYEPKARAEELLSNGVVASVCFPSVPRFGGTLFVDFKDKTLADLSVRAYNDFVLDEWCPGGPEGMFVPMTICQLWDQEKAVAEVQRCIDRGARAISMPENVTHFGLPSYWDMAWDPLWALLSETQIPMCLHIGTAGNYDSYRPSPEAPDSVLIACAGVSMSANALMNLILSPIYTRHPNLKVVFSESGVGWLPYALGRADLVWERYQSPEFPKAKPSEIWRENMWVCQVEEHIGLRFLDLIGSDRVLWELDFPHPDTVYPFSQEHTAEVFEAAGVSEDDAERITHLNAESLFQWTPVKLDH